MKFAGVDMIASCLCSFLLSNCMYSGSATLEHKDPYYGHELHHPKASKRLSYRTQTGPFTQVTAIFSISLSPQAQSNSRPFLLLDP